MPRRVARAVAAAQELGWPADCREAVRARRPDVSGPRCGAHGHFRSQRHPHRQPPDRRDPALRTAPHRCHCSTVGPWARESGWRARSNPLRGPHTPGSDRALLVCERGGRRREAERAVCRGVVCRKLTQPTQGAVAGVPPLSARDGACKSAPRRGAVARENCGGCFLCPAPPWGAGMP
jgi:hypothetical protein